jgi:hypothetical protein
MTKVCSSMDAYGFRDMDDGIVSHMNVASNDGNLACPRAHASHDWFLEQMPQAALLPSNHDFVARSSHSSMIGQLTPGHRPSNGLRLSAGAIQKRMARQKHSQLIKNLRTAISGSAPNLPLFRPRA